MLDQFASAMGLLAEIIAERTGRSPTDVSVRRFAGAIVGAAMAAMFAIAGDPSSDVAETIDQSMACLETDFASDLSAHAPHIWVPEDQESSLPSQES